MSICIQAHWNPLAHIMERRAASFNGCNYDILKSLATQPNQFHKNFIAHDMAHAGTLLVRVRPWTEILKKLGTVRESALPCPMFKFHGIANCRHNRIISTLFKNLREFHMISDCHNSIKNVRSTVYASSSLKKVINIHQLSNAYHQNKMGITFRWVNARMVRMLIYACSQCLRTVGITVQTHRYALWNQCLSGTHGKQAWYSMIRQSHQTVV